MKTYIFGKKVEDAVEAMNAFELTNEPNNPCLTALEGGFDELVEMGEAPTVNDRVLLVGEWYTRTDAAELVWNLRRYYHKTKAVVNEPEV